jgi:hypothetical protein
MSEADKFFSRFENDPQYKESAFTIINQMEQLGKRTGAQYDRFRWEDEASALPLQGGVISVQKLRLYLVWISEQAVILCNGGIKTSQANKDSPDLMPHFRFAKEMAKQINHLQTSNDLSVKHKEIIPLINLNLSY